MMMIVLHFSYCQQIPQKDQNLTLIHCCPKTNKNTSVRHAVALGDIFLHYNEVYTLKPTPSSPHLFQSHFTGPTVSERQDKLLSREMKQAPRDINYYGAVWKHKEEEPHFFKVQYVV